MRMPLRTYVCAPLDQKKLQKNNGIFLQHYAPPRLMWDGSGVIADDTLRDIQDRLSGPKTRREENKTEQSNREK